MTPKHSLGAFLLQGLLLTIVIVSTIILINNESIKENPNLTLIFLIPGGILSLRYLYKLIQKK
jgi:hypothetical protein